MLCSYFLVNSVKLEEYECVLAVGLSTSGPLYKYGH